MVAESNPLVRLCEITDRRFEGIKETLHEIARVLKSIDARLQVLEERQDDRFS